MLAIAGLVCGQPPSSNARRIQGRAVCGTAPTAGQVLSWNAVSSCWAPSSSSSGAQTYKLDGTTAGAETVLDILTGSGITWTLLNPSGKVTAQAAIDTAIVQTKAAAQAGTALYATTGGSSTVYTLALTPTLTAYATGQVLTAKFHAASGATPTINVDTLGARKLYKSNGTSAPAQIGANELQATVYELRYDAALDSAVGGFVVDIGGGGGLADPGGNGIVVRTATNTTVSRTISAGSAAISISNGDGVSGNPTINSATAFGTGYGNYIPWQYGAWNSSATVPQSGAIWGWEFTAPYNMSIGGLAAGVGGSGDNHFGWALYDTGGNLVSSSSSQHFCGGCPLAVSWTGSLVAGTTYYLTLSSDSANGTDTFSTLSGGNMATLMNSAGGSVYRVFTAANTVTWSTGTPTWPSTLGAKSSRSTDPPTAMFFK